MTDKKDKFVYYDSYNLGENDDSILSKAMNVYKKEGLFTLIKKILTYTVYKRDFTFISILMSLDIVFQAPFVLLFVDANEFPLLYDEFSQTLWAA